MLAGGQLDASSSWQLDASAFGQLGVGESPGVLCVLLVVVAGGCRGRSRIRLSPGFLSGVAILNRKSYGRVESQSRAYRSELDDLPATQGRLASAP